MQTVWFAFGKRYGLTRQMKPRKPDSLHFLVSLVTQLTLVQNFDAHPLPFSKSKLPQTLLTPVPMQASPENNLKIQSRVEFELGEKNDFGNALSLSFRKIGFGFATALPNRARDYTRMWPMAIGPGACLQRIYQRFCSHFQTSRSETDIVKIPHSLFERLTNAVCYQQVNVRLLFDLRNNPQEMHNLVNDPAQAKRIVLPIEGKITNATVSGLVTCNRATCPSRLQAIVVRGARTTQVQKADEVAETIMSMKSLLSCLYCSRLLQSAHFSAPTSSSFRPLISLTAMQSVMPQRQSRRPILTGWRALVCALPRRTRQR
jgi:hypothetical protein